MNSSDWFWFIYLAGIFCLHDRFKLIFKIEDGLKIAQVEGVKFIEHWARKRKLLEFERIEEKKRKNEEQGNFTYLRFFQFVICAHDREKKNWKAKKIEEKKWMRNESEAVISRHILLLSKFIVWN